MDVSCQYTFYVASTHYTRSLAYLLLDSPVVSGEIQALVIKGIWHHFKEGRFHSGFGRMGMRFEEINFLFSHLICVIKLNK